MMAAKRVARREMTADNWDDAEEPEEAGSFQQANQEELKTRVIKRAKRRGVSNVAGGEDSASAAPIFKGFTGFVVPPANSNTKSSFSFNTTSNSTADSKKMFSFGQSNGTQKMPAAGSESSDKAEAQDSSSDGPGSDKEKFLGALKNLNESALKWLKSHMDTNPYCFFTPVLKDYEKHLTDLKAKYSYIPTTIPESSQSRDTEDEKSGPSVSTQPSPSKASQTKSSLFSFSGPKSTQLPVGTLTSSLGATEDKTDSKPPAPTTTKPPLFSFGAASSSSSGLSSTAKPSSGFPLFGAATSSFAASTFAAASNSISGAPTTTLGFSFKSAIAGASSQASGSGLGITANTGATELTADDDQYEPPKAEVENRITEDDAVYTQRVKLFYEKEGKYTDKGVGNLFVKSLADNKNSLLIRADTNLGTILLNILLHESIPIKRVGKNNVSMICIPNPPMDPKADPKSSAALLLRVKTETDADELCSKLNEFKKVE